MRYDEIRARFEYKDGELYYRENTSPNARRGQMAGTKTKRGYKQVTCNNRQYKYHRIIYCYFNECDYDDIKGWEIDHLNNIRDDNRIENLCLCEGWENQLNRRDTKENGGIQRYTDSDGKVIITSLGKEKMREYNQRKAKTLYERMNGETLFHIEEQRHYDNTKEDKGNV